MRFSIIVNNYNYARYLRQAIDSALAVQWGDKEVIVVDDGSTDESRAIIASYGERILPVLKENGGQNSAANAGFVVSSGDLVLFLDADDALLTNVAIAATMAHSEGVSKIQFNAVQVDKDGRQLSFKKILTEEYTPEWIRQTYRDTGYYPSPSTSCIVWSRAFLAQIFPMPVRTPGKRWGAFFDDYLSMLAPFFGDVVSLTDGLTLYRVHGENLSGEISGIVGGALSVAAIARTFEEERDRFTAVNDVLMRLKNTTLGKSGIKLEHQLDHMANFLLYKRFKAGTYAHDENIAGVYLKYLKALAVAEGTARRKLKLFAWATVIMAGPHPIAQRAADMRARQRAGGFIS